MIFVFEHATVLSEWDGDTFWAWIDQGCDTFRKQRIRLRGVRAIELDEPRGAEAREVLASLIPVAEPVRLTSHRKTYDRIECDVVRVRDGLDVNAEATRLLRIAGLEGGS